MQLSSSKSTGPTSPDTETCASAESTTWNQLTLLRGDFPARTCPSRGNDRGLRANAPPSGESSPESLASLGPDGLWRRMYQGCFQVMMDGSLETFSGTWPRSGTMRNGTVYQRQPSVPRTSVIGYSSWPTPKASIDGTSPKTLQMVRDGKAEASLQRVVLMPERWPTPRAANPGSRIASTGGKILAQEVEIAEGIRNPLTRKRWPTPRVSMANGPSQAEVEAGNPKRRLETEVACFPTPTASPWRSGNGRRDNGHTPQLPERIGGQLNPTWVEWLMGFPLGWTACDASETPSSPRSPSTSGD